MFNSLHDELTSSGQKLNIILIIYILHQRPVIHVWWINIFYFFKRFVQILLFLYQIRLRIKKIFGFKFMTLW